MNAKNTAEAAKGNGADAAHHGYLDKKNLPNGVALLPPPAVKGSAAWTLDENVVNKASTLKDSPAWDLAIADADMSFPNTASTFSCALDAPITEKDTPHLYRLLQNAMYDASHATHAVKVHYQTPRPFLLNHQPICTPKEYAHLSESGAYVSGHTAAGMAWALILAELSPEHKDAILDRGHAFGLSRIVCNVHWYTDVVEGYSMGAYTVAALHANSEFQDDLKAAKEELTAVRAKGLKPNRDCQVEEQALNAQKALLQH